MSVGQTAGKGEVKNDFTKGSMWQTIVKMAVPMALAQLVNVLYNVVDRMYIGHIPEVGSVALTGLGLTMPMVSLIAAFANLCGGGGGPLCSIARGEKRLDYAEKVMGNAFSMLLFLSVVLTLGFSLFMRPILYLFGASDVTYPYAADYARIYVLGTTFVLITLGMNSFINAQGFARIGMFTVIIGAVINIILDPILIFVFDMGIRGAAIATVFSQACSAAWAMQFLTSRKAVLEFKGKNLKPDWKIIGRIIGLGTTNFVMNATNSLVQIVNNIQLQAFGGDLYVGAMTVINSIREVIFMVVHGLSQGAQPVLGYNYGAKAYSRVREGISFMSWACVVYSVVAWGITMALPRKLVMIFNDDPEMIEVCLPAMRIFFAGLIVMSLQTAGQSIFVGLGMAKHAVFFSLLRKAVIVVPLVLILPNLWGLGATGVFLSEPISDFIGGVACYATMYFAVYRRMAAPDGAPLPERPRR